MWIRRLRARTDPIANRRPAGTIPARPLPTRGAIVGPGAQAATLGIMGAPPKDLVLVRLALVTFTPAPTGWREWTLRIDDIEVGPVSPYESEDKLRLLVGGATTLDYRPKVTSDGLVVVPPKQREAAERAIELAANLISVAQGCRRHIASPWPPVVFVATGDDGRGWLAEQPGAPAYVAEGDVPD
jgi:hypothetical protein